MLDPILTAFTLVLIVLYLAPALLGLLLWKPPERASTWLALAAPLAVAIQIGLESVVKIFVTPLTFGNRLLATGAVSLALLVAVLGMRKRFPVRTGADWRAIGCAAGVTAAFVVTFGKVVWYRELTSDGVEALEMARQLATHWLPRWPSESGLKGFGQGLIALAFPNAWFDPGTLETPGPRISFVMFLGVIAAQVMALVEGGREGRIERIAAGAVALSVFAAGAVLGLQTSFDPYFADPANPAGPEVMAVAMMLGAWVALREGRTGVFLIAAVLAHATLPSGLLFVVVLGAAWFIVKPAMRVVFQTAAAVGLCVLVTLLYEKVYVPHVLPAGVAMDAGSESIAGRMRLLIFTDWTRFAFLVIPCGIVPFFFLFFWKKQDEVGRVATLATAAMFLFFFVLATYSPHYFAPAMMLVLVPFWRCAKSVKAAWIGLAGAVAGLAVSLPPFHPDPQPYEALGEKIWVEPRSQGARLADLLAPADLLQRLAYLPWNDVDAEKQFVASGLQLVACAVNRRQGSGSGFDGEDWVVQPEGAPLTDYSPVASQGGYTLWARAGASIEAVREHGFRTDFQRPWFRVPRGALFRVFTEREHRYDVDLRALFGRYK